MADYCYTHITALACYPAVPSGTIGLIFFSELSFCEDLPLSFAIELLKPLAEGNPKAFATVKEHAG